MKQLHDLTDLQLAILREIWRRKRATVTDIYEALLDETGLAKKTIATMMTRLEKQGFLEHSAEGREFVYEPTVSEEEVGRAKVRNIVDRLFGGSVTALVSHALEAKDVKPGDVERVRALIAELDKKKPKERKR
ncbi:MAG TPA: BlaI/MecI/CopY family transcriptional regulator [Thermoanaerobaculia bacterium]|nr:BlaI/MecI/CopY family transcriptional regulator [Thermoanaerobaculia bacterium]